MFKTIVVAVDGSEGSKKAIQYGAEMQVRYDAQLFLLTVFRHHSLLEASMSMVRPENPQNLDDAMRDHAKEVADEAKVLAREAGANNFRAFVKGGQPARTIVKFSAEHDADLIVVGSRGMGDIEGFLLGSVSHKVTSLASCPVLVV
jgi:nucleotide-binding universal stress UspA family protein